MTLVNDIGTDRSLQFRRLAVTLQRRKGFVLAVAAAGTLMVSIAAIATRPSYRAVAEIVLAPSGPATPGESAKPSTGADLGDSAVDTQIAMLTSPEQLCRLVAGLADRPELAPAKNTGWLRAALQPVRAMASVGLAWIRGPGSPDPVTDECGRPAGTPGPTIMQIKAGLKIFQQRRSMVIAVSYTGDSPAVAAAVVNEIVEQHVREQRNRRHDEAARVVAWLDQRLAAAVTARDEAENAVRQYRLSNGEDPASAETLRPMIETRRQLAAAQADYNKRQALLDRVLRMQQEGAALGSIAAALALPPAGEQEQPPQFAADVQEAIGRLKDEARFSQLQAQAIRSQMETMQRTTAEPNDGKPSLPALEQRAAMVTRLIEDLQRRHDDSLQERDLPNADASVFTLARPPLHPISIQPLLLVPAGFVAFLMLGAALAITRDRLDTSLRNEHEVSDALGIACIGVIPEARLPDSSAVPDMRPTYQQAIRSALVTVLQMARPQRDPRIVLITSSVPREGKSMLAVSLALCAARLGARVLLIDLSPAKHESAPRDGQRAGENGRVLVPRENTAIDLIRPMGSQGYDYLPGSEIGADLLGFLASHQGHQLFLAVRDRYDFIIIDGPPVLGSPEVRILAAFADDVLFAIRWGETRREVAENAAELLRRASATDGSPSTRLKAVLTRADPFAHARYGYGNSAEVLRVHGTQQPSPVRRVRLGRDGRDRAGRSASRITRLLSAFQNGRPGLRRDAGLDAAE